jgi:hypothetical protein
LNVTVDHDFVETVQRLGDMPRINWKASILIAACLVLAAWSFALVYEGFISDHYSSTFTWPFIDEPAAERAYQRLSPNAPVKEREIAAYRLIQADPTNPDSWIAVSYVEFLKAGSMSPKALEALDHSYAVSFFDRQGGVWRIGYALENWAALPPSLRKDVLTEADVALKDNVLGPKLKARLAQVKSPQGQLAAIMMQAQAEAEMAQASAEAQRAQALQAQAAEAKP